MTSLYNIKTIDINGNSVDKIAKNYNTHLKNKTTQVASLKAVEECINLNKTICNYEFNKQHNLNLTYGNIVVKDNYDVTYNTCVSLNEDTNTFIYDTQKIISGVTSKVVYVSKTVKKFNTNETYTFDVQYGAPITTILDSTKKSLYFNYPRDEPFGLVLKPGFFNYDSGFLVLTEETKNTLLTSYNKKINHVYTKFLEEDFEKVTEGGYKLKDDVGIVLLENTLEITTLSTIPDSYDNLSIICARNSSYNMVFKSDIIETLYMDDIGLYITSSNFVMPNLKDVYYNKNLSINNPTLPSTTDLHVMYSYRKLGLGLDIAASVTCKDLYITSEFFDNVDLDTVVVKYFGDWSNKYVTKISRLIVDISDINCTLTGDALKTRLRTILALNNSIELIAL